MHRTHGIAVRPFVADDAASLHRAVRASLGSLSYWLPWCHPDYSLDDARQWVAQCAAGWARGTAFAMGIFDASGEVLGGVGLSEVDRAARTANLGYWVGDAHRGRGVATAAARRAARIAFDELGLARLTIAALSHNVASQRVATRLGARCLGQLGDRLVFRGRPAPAFVYALEPGDLAAAPRTPAGE